MSMEELRELMRELWVLVNMEDNDGYSMLANGDEEICIELRRLKPRIEAASDYLDRSAIEAAGAKWRE